MAERKSGERNANDGGGGSSGGGGGSGVKRSSEKEKQKSAAFNSFDSTNIEALSAVTLEQADIEAYRHSPKQKAKKLLEMHGESFGDLKKESL